MNGMLYRTGITVDVILSGGNVRIFQVSRDVLTLVVDSLTPDTEYIFMVSAANQHGMGKESDGVYGETSSIGASEGKNR